MGKLYAARLGEKPEQGSVGVKRPACAALYKLQSRFITPELQFSGNFASERPIGQADDLADPFNIDDIDSRTRHDVNECAPLCDLF